MKECCARRFGVFERKGCSVVEKYVWIVENLYRGTMMHDKGSTGLTNKVVVNVGLIKNLP